MDTDSDSDTKEQPGSPASAASPPTSPLLTTSGKKYYGLGNPTRSEEDLSLSSVYFNKHTDESTNLASRICNLACLLLVFASVILLIVGCVLFHYLPNPTVTSTQGVRQGDTVPIYVADKAELPQSVSTFWYSSIQVSLATTESKSEDVASKSSNDTRDVMLLYREGNTACFLLPGHNDTIEVKKSNVTFEKNLTIQSYQYLTVGDEVTLNVTITNGAINKCTAYIMDSAEAYNCFISNSTNNVSACDYTATYPIVSSTKIDFTPNISSYYYLVLVATEENSVAVNYTYQASTHFYDITDYDTFHVCDMDRAEMQSCSFDLNGRRGCLFAYGTERNDTMNEYVALSVKVHHNIWNFPSLGCLAVALAIFILTVSILILKYGFKYIRKYC